MKKIILNILGILFTQFLSASPVQDSLRGNAKFNVVAVVLVIIFIGISLFLYRIDKRLTKLEKEGKEMKK